MKAIVACARQYWKWTTAVMVLLAMALVVARAYAGHPPCALTLTGPGSVAVGDTGSLAAGGGVANYSWASSAAGTATVAASNGDGTTATITAVAAGTVTITVTDSAQPPPPCSKTIDIAIVGVTKIVSVAGTPAVESDGPLLDKVGDAIALRAKPDPATATFPNGKPTWTVTTKPTDSTAAVPAAGADGTFTPDKVGEFVLTATCGTSSATFTIDAITIDFQEVDAKPSNALALNDAIIEQLGIVGVLESWSVQFVADVQDTKAGDTYQWQYANHGTNTWNNLGTGLTYAQDNVTMGDYDVRLKVKRVGFSGEVLSSLREIQVAKVKYISLEIRHDSADYQKDAANTNWVNYPEITQAKSIQIKGEIDWETASPQPENIKQGMIQGIVCKMDVVYSPTTWVPTWDAGAVAGDTIPYAADYHATYADVPQVNDAPPKTAETIHYLYDNSTSNALGAQFSIFDLPHENDETFPKSTTGAKGSLVTTYKCSKYIYNYNFEDWLVVEVTTSNAAKPQFVPLKKIPWQLHIDTTAGAGPWKCSGIANNPVAPTKPTDGSATSSDDSASLQKAADVNFVHP